MNIVPVVTVSWRFWGLGWYAARQPGKMTVYTVGFGPLRLSWLGAYA